MKKPFVPKRRVTEDPDASPVSCPLCGEAGSRPVDVLSGRLLARSYVQSLGEDLAPVFAAGVPEELTLRECCRCGLRFFRPVFAGADDLYARLQTRSWYYEREKPEYQIAARSLPQVGRLLDVGCGAGHFREHVPWVEYVGLELNPVARAEAVARGLEVRAELLEQHADAFAGTYDAVVAFQVLEHVPDPRGMLLAARRCMRPGGLLVISVPSFDGFLGRAANHVLNLPPHHQTLWPDAALRHVAAMLGAELRELVPERLRAVHRCEARRVMVEDVLRRISGGRARVLTDSLDAVLRTRLASIVCRVVPWSLLPEPRGHSVTAVYAMGADR